MALMKIRDLKKNIPKEAKELCNHMLADLEKGRKPVLEATKCSLDNSFYNPM